MSQRSKSLLLTSAAVAFCLLALCAGGWLLSYATPAWQRPEPGTLGAVRHGLHHGLSLSARRPPRSSVELDLGGLEVGDVVLASQADNPYGYFAHVSAVTGPDQTLGQNAAYGIDVMPLHVLVGYDDIRILRARLSKAQKRAIASFLRGLRGERFNVIALKDDPRFWNCSKAVWAAFHRVGIDLAPARDLVLPDDIAASPELATVRVIRSAR